MEGESEEVRRTSRGGSYMFTLVAQWPMSCISAQEPWGGIVECHYTDGFECPSQRATHRCSRALKGNQARTNIPFSARPWWPWVAPEWSCSFAKKKKNALRCGAMRPRRFAARLFALPRANPDAFVCGFGVFHVGGGLTITNPTMSGW